MVGRWSEAATLKFVYFYKLHECLWNPRSEFYNQKDARNFAYVDLVLQMKMPDFDLRAAKVKIKNLRAHYISELKKVRYAAAVGDRYEPTLYWFKEMDSFLRDTIGDIPSLHQPEVITADSIYDSSSIYESGFGDDEDSMEKPMPFLHISDTRSLAPPKKSNKNDTSTTSSGGRGGGGGGAPSHRRINSSYRPGPASSKRRRKQKEAILGEEYADEFEAFGRSVSAQLRKLSLSRALRAQSKIQAILTEERIQDLEATTAAASPPPPPPPSLPLPLPLQLPPPPAAAVLPTSPHDLSFGLGVVGTPSTTSLTNTTDSGVDSGIDTTTSSSSSSSSSSSTSSAASSVAGGLPSPTTPTSIDSSSMPLGGITTTTTTESTTTSSTSTSSSSSSSSSSIKALKEFRKSVPDPTPALTPPPNSDVIIKAECELITLDEDDPFEGH